MSDRLPAEQVNEGRRTFAQSHWQRYGPTALVVAERWNRMRRSVNTSDDARPNHKRRDGKGNGMETAPPGVLKPIIGPTFTECD